MGVIPPLKDQHFKQPVWHFLKTKSKVILSRKWGLITGSQLQHQRNSQLAAHLATESLLWCPSAIIQWQVLSWRTAMRTSAPAGVFPFDTIFHAFMLLRMRLVQSSMFPIREEQWSHAPTDIQLLDHLQIVNSKGCLHAALRCCVLKHYDWFLEIEHAHFELP